MLRTDPGVTAATVRLTWNLVDDVRTPFTFHFMVNAFRAGTIVAIIAAGIGWFVVLRRETFAGHTLAVVGFPGGAAAVWLGIAAVWGYFAFCIVAAGVIASLPGKRARGYIEETAAIGTLQAFALACGFLFVSRTGGFASGFSSLLFGSFLGVTDAQVVTLLVIGLATVRRRRRNRTPVAVRVGRSRCRAGAWCARSPPVDRVPRRASVSPSPRPARSPARCWCSRCSSCRRRPRSADGASRRRFVRVDRDRPRDHVARVGSRLLLGVPARVLDHHDRVRGVRRRSHDSPVRGSDAVSAIEVVLATGSGLTEMLAHPFMRHAFVAGTAIAVASGLVGYFVVLRSQVFSGDALSHAAFAGALGALALGVDLRLGLFVVTAAVALGMGWLGPHGRADDVVIGTVFTWVLGLGVLFASRFTSSGGAADGSATVKVLFGSILGLSASQAQFAAIVGLLAAAVVLAIGRPLLFASVDAAVAAARGVPVRIVGVGFIVLVGVTAAEATQAVGALLLVGLVAAPAGAAQRLTDRPWRGLALAAALAVLAVWMGLTISYVYGSIAPSFAIMSVATGIYGLAHLRSVTRSAEP